MEIKITNISPTHGEITNFAELPQALQDAIRAICGQDVTLTISVDDNTLAQHIKFTESDGKVLIERPDLP